MKKILALAALALALTATLSCEQQSWEQTKIFKQTRHAGGHGAHGEAAPAHGPAAAGHGEKAAH